MRHPINAGVAAVITSQGHWNCCNSFNGFWLKCYTSRTEFLHQLFAVALLALERETEDLLGGGIIILAFAGVSL